MKGFLRSKLIVTLAAAFAMIAVAVIIPVASSKFTPTPAHAAKARVTQRGHSWPHDALSSGPLLAEAIRSGSVHVTSLSTGQSNDPQLTCSPSVTPCVLPNVQASGGNPPGTGPVNETPVAANPALNGSLLTGGNDFNCPTLQGFYVTIDKGSTWNSTCMLPLPGEIGEGDPGVGYNLSGVAFIVGLDATPAGLLNAVAIEHSTNNGLTWSSSSLVATPVLPGGEVDMPRLQVDDNPISPHVNALYVSTTQFGPAELTSTIAVSHSTNGGATWSTTVVDTVQPSLNVDQTSDLAIGLNGTVYVSWMRCSATGPTGDCGGSTATFFVSRSTDGGNTWSVPSPIATVQLTPDTCTTTICFFGNLPNTQERLFDTPAIGIQHGPGESSAFRFFDLYASFYNWTGTFMQVKVAHSSNGGQTWDTPVPVAPSTDTHDQFLPWLQVNRDGTAGVTWLDRRNDPANVSYEAFAALSTNGGFISSQNFQLASTPSNPNNDGFGGTFMGDYRGSSWFNKTLYTSWPDSRNGVTMQDEVGGLSLFIFPE